MTLRTPLSYISQTNLQLGPATEVKADGPWRIATGDDGILWLVLDVPGQEVNTISASVLDGLNAKLDAIEYDPPKAVVIRSGKSSGFAVGADIYEFESLIDEGCVPERLTESHAVLDRLSALSCPTIAVVHGAALGAGCELALACDRRLAIVGASFGLPEIQLGLHPGLGGTFRLTNLIDPIEAMTLMLTGKTAHTEKAKSLGIVEEVIEERHVLNAVKAAAEGEMNSNRTSIREHALSFRAGRSLAATKMRQKAEETAPSAIYPAPEALISLWETHGDDPKAMQRAEIKSFAELLDTATARNLRRVFFLRQTLKSAADPQSGIGHVHVIGAGAMGADIAAWSAIKGLTVSLEDINTIPLGEAVARLLEIADDVHLSPQERRDASDRMMPDPKGYGLAKADLVIEAAPEDVDLKAKIYNRLEHEMDTEAILATNTSSLNLGELSQNLKRPDRFAGLHFFNPVHKMQLVEVVAHSGTSPEVIERLSGFCGQISRLPARVAAYPGFLVNRALAPYLLEAMVMIEEGTAPADIDQAAEAFGLPVGPVELADQVGLDICLAVGESLKANLDKPLAEISDRLRALVEEGRTGKKAGAGLYTWSNGRADKPYPTCEAEGEITDRLILPMLDACVECLRKEIIGDAKTLDAAMIFATGFAPYTGGPMNYAKKRGPDEIRAKLSALAETHGPRFTPDEGWGAL